ncbi:MAG: RHS repeat-associated core domain-containing protein [Nitrospira sp.]|nr:RHS repeat-associated core domain-containing protein [Nitrospira sp.]
MSDDVHKFTGKELDFSSNLYFYEARYYHAVFGRFIAPDTIVPNLYDPQSLNRYSYARNNPLYYTDPSGHFFWAVVALGVVAGVVSSGIQSNWDLEATLLGGVIGGVSAGVGYGTFGPAMGAFADLGFGTLGSGIAGGAVAGGVAGGTSGVLANLAGYRVNIGLAIASGAAAGGIVGGAGATQWGQWGALAAAPAAGASGAAISGADPGMGAAIAAATAAFALGVNQAYEAYQAYAASQSQTVGASQQSAPEYVRVRNFESEVVRKSINISKDGILSFDVRVTGLEAGGGISTRLQTGFLKMDLAGRNDINFRDWTSLPGRVGTNGIANFSVSVSGVTGPAYMRIIPQNLAGQPPVITNFGPGLGQYIPCNPCRSQLNYDQAY